MNKITINRKAMEQVVVLERVKKRDITQREAAEQLGCSERWIRALMRRYREYGAQGIIHGNTGKPSVNKISKKNENQAIELLQARLQGAGPTYLSEKLFELYGIKINEESMRQIMIRRGLWVASRSKPKHRIRRPRRTQVGIMVQLDGSPHDWLEGRGPRSTLLVFIDDATSRILWLEFVTGESVEEVMKATSNYLKKFGRPISFYVDYGSVWSVNTNNPDRDKLTQFERAMKELDIEVIHARSPQAKGRVERANKTLQDRLVKDMRLAHICSREAANKFAQDTYISKHNDRFAIDPAESIDAHRSLDGFDLYQIMSIKAERIIMHDYTISYRNQLFQLTAEQSTIIRPKESVTVCRHLDGQISIFIRKTQLHFFTIVQRPEKIIPPKPVRPEIYRKPSANSRAWNSGRMGYYKPAPTTARTQAASAE